MRTFDVTHDNDIFFRADGNVARAQGERAVMLVCEQFARAARGEMIHKMDRGIPFWPVAFGRAANLSQFEAAFRARMAEIPEVIAVDSFIATITDTVLKYEATIETEFGQVSVNNG